MYKLSNYLFYCRYSTFFFSFFFFFNDTAPTEIYTLSLHDALPISDVAGRRAQHRWLLPHGLGTKAAAHDDRMELADRKSTRLNSSHMSISYAVFCLKKKKKKGRLVALSY